MSFRGARDVPLNVRLVENRRPFQKAPLNETSDAIVALINERTGLPALAYYGNSAY
jgi:hypothetical protein